MSDPPDALPLAVPPGRLDYYRLRHDDFARRHPALTPPGYYLEFGDRYAHRFMIETARDLGPRGRSWVTRTLSLLQEKIERRRESDPLGFDALERDPAAFRAFAFDTHSDAYVEAGLAELPLEDLTRILTTPDLRDLLTFESVLEVDETKKSLVIEWVTGRRVVIDWPGR